MTICQVRKTITQKNYEACLPERVDCHLVKIQHCHSSIISGCGKPNLICRNYESSPGLWMFDDRESEITFYVWSDGWKKHAWKGASFEFTGNKAKLPQAYSRLINHLNEKRKEPE